MGVSYMTSTRFSTNPSQAKRQADEQPVVITEHGKPRYVLMCYADFEANWRKPKSLYEALRDPHATVEGDLDPDRLSFEDRDAPF